MWFMNTIANPFVRLILRSPLHWIFSSSVLLIRLRGRKTGRQISLPVNYAQKGDFLFIVPGMPEKKTWWRNLRGGAEVEVALRGQRRKGFAEILGGETDCPAVAEALQLYFQRFPASARMRNLRQNADGSFPAEEMGRVAKESIVARIKL